MIDYEALFRAERAKVEELEETIRQLRDARPPTQIVMPSVWPVRMSPAEKIVCAVLLESSKDQYVTNDQLSDAIAQSDYAYARRGEDFQKTNIVKVYVTRVRKKLRPFNVEIINIWGSGYYIPKDGIEAWKTATERQVQ